MGFDSRTFLKDAFQPRIESISVPALAAWFSDGEKPEWQVRGLTGEELARCNEIQQQQINIAAAISAMTTEREKIAEIKSLLGISEKVPDDLAKRMEMLAIASVQPEITLDVSVKLAERFPIEFYQLTNVILRLTGMGQLPGKQQPSGKMQKSALQ